MLAYSEYDLYRDGTVPGRGPIPTYSPAEATCLKDRKWWAFLLSSIFTFLVGEFYFLFLWRESGYPFNIFLNKISFCKFANRNLHRTPISIVRIFILRRTVRIIASLTDWPTATGQCQTTAWSKQAERNVGM